MYLENILNKYAPRNLDDYTRNIAVLKSDLKQWASSCYISVLNSGSREKGTAISIASDVDYLVSLTSDCNVNSGGLKKIYDGLYNHLKTKYNPVRTQNVSFRINIDNLEVDITPARKHSGNTNDHWLYVSKQGTWKQTNIQKHISDISGSGRTKEIMLLKIWREQNGLEFPSIYLEYLSVKSLSGKSKNPSQLSDNFLHLLNELAKDTNNPMDSRIIDPANSNNILSDLLTTKEKKTIISRAKISIGHEYWEDIIR